MIELPETDLWALECDARVITTNGSVRRDGCAVMGRGCALQAARRWPHLSGLLGSSITIMRQRGVLMPTFINNLEGHPEVLVCLPVKYAWPERADLKLILRGLRDLVEVADRRGWQRVVMPRPGCGNGKLDWERQVRPNIAPLLNDRFTVVSY